jgi:hypothetical protein
MKSIRMIVALGCALATVPSVTAVASAAERHFQADLQTTSQFVPLALVETERCVDEDGHKPVLGLLRVIGAGKASILGPVVDEQSHCVRADFSFFDGRFTLTNAEGNTISGRYFGQLVPTFNSTFPLDAPPGGQWLVFGNVCIEGGSVGIEDDCQLRHYQPARGITNLNTGDATIFLDQSIRVED